MFSHENFNTILVLIDLSLSLSSVEVIRSVLSTISSASKCTNKINRKQGGADLYISHDKKHQEKMQKTQPPWDSSLCCAEKSSRKKAFLLHPFPRYINILQANFSPQKKRNTKLLTTAHSSLCNLSYRQVSYAKRKFRMIKLFYQPQQSEHFSSFQVYLCIWLLLLESWQGCQGRLHSSQIHLNRWFPSWWFAGVSRQFTACPEK